MGHLRNYKIVVVGKKTCLRNPSNNPYDAKLSQGTEQVTWSRSRVNASNDTQELTSAENLT